MPKKIFRNYPQLNYSLSVNDNTKVGSEFVSVLTIYGLDNNQNKRQSTKVDTQVVRDITKLFKIKDNILSNILVYYPYTIKDSDTLEKIADIYYGDPYYFWLILIANNMINPYYDWPLGTQQFQEYIDSKYANLEPGISGFKYANTHYLYYTSTGHLVDSTTYSILTGVQAVGKYTISLYDDEFNMNEAKKNIKLIGKQFLNRIESELSNLFR